MVAAVIGGILASGAGFAQEAREVSTTNFRPGGNLSLLASFQQMSWDVKQAGEVRDVEEWSFAPGLAARYAFHFQLLKKFGGVVGTEIQMTYEGANVGSDVVVDACGERGFRPGASVLFPSMMLGVVQNFVEDRRFMFLGQYGAAWYPWMKTCGGSQARDQLLAAIPHTISLLGQFDLFSSEGTAWSVGAGARLGFLRCVGTASVCDLGAQKTSILERLDVSVLGFFFQAGVTWPTGGESLWR